MFITTSKQSVKNNLNQIIYFYVGIRTATARFLANFLLSAQVAETTKQNVIWLRNLALPLKNVSERKLWYLSLYAFKRVLEV